MRLLFFLSMFSSTLCSQSNWQPGYVIKDGVKTAGEINNRNWSKIAGYIQFRSSPTEEAIVFLPTDEISFEVRGRRFVGRKINYISNSRRVQDLTQDTVLHRDTTWAFLQQHLSGELSLYQFVDQQGKHHFYLQRSDQPLKYLEYERRLRRDVDKKEVLYSENFKYQLAQSLRDCPSLSGRITATDYNLKNLTRAVKAWYRCQELQPDYIAAANQGDLQVGGVLSNLRTTAIVQDPGRGTITEEPHRGPAPGLGLRYEFLGRRLKFGLKTEGLYHSFKDVVHHHHDNGLHVSNRIHREFSAKVIQLNLLAELGFAFGKTSIYTEGGIVVGYLLESDQSFRHSRTRVRQLTVSYTRNLNTPTNMTNEIGWLTGIGLRYGGFQVGWRIFRVTRPKSRADIGFHRSGVIGGYWF